MSCRFCDQPLHPQPVLDLPGMPASAQGFLETPDDRPRLFDLHLRACSSCGLVQLDAEPVAYYRSVITAAGWSEEMTAFRRRQMDEFVRRFALRDRSVLEVGCGAGHLLDLLAAAGARPVGLEAGKAAIEAGRDRGRRIHEGYITDTRLPEAPFAAAVCINFLEHAPRPADFLRAIAGTIEDDGVALIEVPALDQAIEKRRYYDFIRDHLSYFSADTLQRGLEATGFEVLDLDRVWHRDDLCAIVRKRAVPDFRPWIAENAVIAHFNALVADPRHRRIAVWGASHQAMSLLAIARPTRVAYIVDSSPTKQGKFDPVLALPIVAPSRLSEDSPDLAIVMAAGYSDEVHRQLRGPVGFRGTIAILRDGRFEISGPLG